MRGWWQAIRDPTYIPMTQLSFLDLVPVGAGATLSAARTIASADIEYVLDLDDRCAPRHDPMPIAA